MDLTVTESISVITVLIQGFLSFFSPCVLPLLPLYIGYLSGGTGTGSAEGEAAFDRKRVMLNTLCFVIGIGFSFLLLGLGMRAVGRFFSGNQMIFARIGGIIVILFGLYQLGLFGKSSVLSEEKRLPVSFDKMAMSPLTALIMGFVFSFAWTPCVGPTLSGVLLMAASAKSSATGLALIGVYTLGFSLPFLLTGIFTTSILNFFREHRGVVKYTVKISGVLLIIMGILMVTGYMNSITGFLSRFSAPGESIEEEGDTETEETVETASMTEIEAEDDADVEEDDDIEEDDSGDWDEDAADYEDPSDDGEETDLLPAPDFTLTDQYGETHTLSDYRGKVVFLNFWATWCPPCRGEMPDIQAIYEETLESPDSDVVILGVAFPNEGDELSEEGIRNFMKDNGYTYPTVMDHDASLALPYYITAYPTTYLINRDGNVFGYIPGAMTKDMMEEAIEQTKEGR